MIFISLVYVFRIFSKILVGKKRWNVWDLVIGRGLKGAKANQGRVVVAEARGLI